MRDQDYRPRMGRVLPDGGASPGSNLKMVEVLGCRMWMEEADLSVEGDPTGGQFKLRYDGYTSGALDWDAAASDVQTELNNLFAAQNLNIVVACSGGPLPDAAISIIGDDFDPILLKPLFGKLTGGDLLSNATWSGSDPIFCSVLDASALVTFEVIEATPAGPHYARGVRAAAQKIGSDSWLLGDAGGNWYAQVYDMANYGTDGLKILMVHGGPAEPHEAVNDSTEDESGWSDGRYLTTHPYLGTWHVIPLDCEV